MLILCENVGIIKVTITSRRTMTFSAEPLIYSCELDDLTEDRVAMFGKQMSLKLKALYDTLSISEGKFLGELVPSDSMKLVICAYQKLISKELEGDNNE